MKPVGRPPYANTPRPDVLGFEFDWLAVDEFGNVGLFSTAGGGYAPGPFLQDPEAHAAAISSVLSLPPTTQAVSYPAVAQGLANTWKRVAERGLFAFDSDADGGPYRRVAVPARPVRLSELPRPVRELANLVPLPSVDFAKSQAMLVSDLSR